MKIKDKKGQAAMEFLMTYRWAILAAIIAIGILGYYYSILPQYYNQDYLIEKEVCHNETEVFTVAFNKKPDVANVPNLEISKLRSCISGSGYDNKWFCEFEKVTPICTKESVDEINQRILVWVGNECIDGYLGGKKYDSLGNEEPHCEVIENKTYQINNIKISKSEITEEFLRNNCECIECEPLDTSKEWGWESIRDGDKIISCSKQCLKYTCQFQDKYFITKK